MSTSGKANHLNVMRKRRRKARKLFQKAKFREAIGEYSEAMKMVKPNTAGEEISRILIGRSSAWTQVGNFHRAIEDADNALLVSPRSPRAYAKKGNALIRLQAYKEASQAFLVGLECDPTNQELQKGFQDSLQGLRTQCHQYFPAYSHGGIGQFEQSFHTTHSSALTYATHKHVKKERLQPVRNELLKLAEEGQKKGSPDEKGVANKEDTEKLQLVHNVLIGNGAILQVDDLIAREKEWWKKNTTWPFEDRDQMKKLYNTLSTHRWVLFALFCTFCEKVVKNISIENKLFATFAGPEDSNKPRRKKLFHMKQMEFLQFKQCAVSLKLFTKNFSDTHITSVWKIITKDMNDNSVPGVGGVLIQHSGPKPPDICERLLYAFDEHIKSRNDVDSAMGLAYSTGYSSINRKSVVNPGKKPTKPIKSSATGVLKRNRPGKRLITTRSQNVADDFNSPMVRAVLDKYRQRLQKIFTYFAVEKYSEGLMGTFELFYFINNIGILNKQNLKMETAIQTYVVVTGFLGFPYQDGLEFDKFVAFIARCLEVKTYDGMVSLDQRLNAAFAADLFQQVKTKTKIASLWL
eukprot:g2684.t1